MRRYAIRIQGAINHSSRGWIKKQLAGVALPGKSLGETTAEMKKAIEGGKELPSPVADAGRAASVYCGVCAQSRGPIDDLRDSVEAQMRSLAESLPVWAKFKGPKSKDVPGFGSLGLAIIVGEAGDLSRFPGPDALKKWMGAAPPNCYLKLCKNGELKPCPPKSTYAELYAVCDSLLKQENKYRECYHAAAERIAAKLPDQDKGKQTKTGKRSLHKHGELMARRVPAQELLKDLWRAWRDAANGEGQP